MRISVLFLLLVISPLPLGSASAADQWPTLTVSLRIAVDGRSIEGQRELTSGKYRTQAEFDKAFDRNVIPLKVDHSAQLKVEMIDKNGTVIDVTRSPHTHYYSVASTAVSVSPKGLVVAKPDKPLSPSVPETARYALAKVRIEYIDRKAGNLGYNAVLFDVVPGANEK